MRNTLILASIVALLLGGSIWWSKSMQNNDTEVISRNGIHWHPTLEIFVKGEKQELPTNIGISPLGMTPIHTHDDATLGIVHLEFSGLVRKEDITLGQFFANWGKDMNSFGTSVKMTVNGIENTELENYVMHDKDKIELRYE